MHKILDHKMVSAVHGSLIETDIPCKVYILHINEKLPPAERFVIQDLDGLLLRHMRKASAVLVKGGATD